VWVDKFFGIAFSCREVRAGEKSLDSLGNVA